MGTKVNNENKIMYDLLKEMREEQKKLVEKTNQHREETSIWQSKTSDRLETIEIDLREHKEGVIQNRSTLKVYNERLVKLEEPGKVKEFMYNHSMKIFKIVAAAGGAITVIGKVLGWF